MQHRPFLVLSDHFTRQGIAVLRFDDRGVGESGGEFGTATTVDFTSDALAGVAFLRERQDIDPSWIGIVGHSEGGLVAPMAAAESPDVAFIVMMAGPGVTGREIVLEQGALIARAAGSSEQDIQRSRETQIRLFSIVEEEEDPEAASPILMGVIREQMTSMTEEERAAANINDDNQDVFIRTQVRQVNSPWFRFFLTYDPVPTLRQVSVPVLAINGELDLQVPPYQNLPVIERALQEGGNTDVTVVELPGLNHLFQTCTTGSPLEYASIEETISPTALDLMSDWILERAGG
jgi:pimeloyl-ACP methyl ester carboxylesterase